MWKKHFNIFVIVFAVSLLGAMVWTVVRDFGSAGAPAQVLGLSIAAPTPTPEPPKPTHVKTPDAVKAIYMTSWVAGTSQWRKDLVNFIKKTEINSLVIDVKDYTGMVAFDTESELIKEEGSEEIRVAEMKKFIEELHASGIYTIARITVFQDPYYSKRHQDIAVQKKNGTPWKDRKGLSYLDPGAQKYWDYVIEIARASERAGFDELNFDYIRFPSDGNMKDIYFPISNKRNKVEVLSEFFKYLDEKLSDLPTPISADVFGMTTSNYDDLNIGQVLESIAPHFDYIAPMVYPSHYPPTFHGYKNPAAHPYDIVLFAMSEGAKRLAAPTSTPLKLRPWLQDFDLGMDYGRAEVRAQIKATYDAGLTSWMIWDPANKYTRSAFDPE